MYKRKTKTEWQVYINYGSGYEYVIASDDLDIARQYCKDYRANSPEYPAKIVHKRVKLEDAA